MNWNIVLFAVLTVAVVALILFVIQLVQKLTRVAAALEETLKTISELSPRVEAVLESAERELDQLGSVTKRLDSIVGDVEQVSASVSKFAVPAADVISSVFRPVKVVGAVISGFRTGLSMFDKFRGGTHNDSPSYQRHGPEKSGP